VDLQLRVVYLVVFAGPQAAVDGLEVVVGVASLEARNSLEVALVRGVWLGLEDELVDWTDAEEVRQPVLPVMVVEAW
jgi:hypothetical protein